MPTSPRTPAHSRGPSNIDLSFASPLSYNSSPRRQSKASLRTPTSPNHHNRTRSDSIGENVFAAGGTIGASNGLGNLADELADMWGDEEEEGEEGEDIDMMEESDLNFADVQNVLGLGIGGRDEQRDSGVDVNESPIDGLDGNGNVSPKRSGGVGTAEAAAHLTLSPPPVMMGGRGHRRQQPSEYDGSDYGGDSDLDSPGMLPGLVARMDMVESLARRGTEDNGTERDGVVKRVVESLKDLGSQSGVEGNATRLITAHSALSTNLLHQTRLLQSLAYPLFSPLSLPPDSEYIDTLLPLLVSLSTSIPRPTTTSLTSITQLHALTADLIQTLNYLSDTLHMSRQTTATASRRLRSARELVAEMRRDEERREEGEKWLESNRWGERLKGRECAAVCGDVVGGFEEVCEGWRRRLVEQGEQMEGVVGA